MLNRLYVQNFALIDKIEIDFAPGLNILTGETGAGKSILLGAMGLIMGKRADSSVVIADEKCIVEAEFAIDDITQFIQEINYQALQDNSNGNPNDKPNGDSNSNAPENISDELDLEGNTIILRREITKAGKSRAFINDSPVNLNTLKQITTHLIDIHGQHDGQQLLDEDTQLRIIDQYAQLEPLTTQFAQQLNELRGIDRKIKKLQDQEEDAKRQLDFLLFQSNELEKAELNAPEENTIEQELTLLENAELVSETLAKSIFQIYDDENAIRNQIALLTKDLEKIAEFHPDIKNEAEKLIEVRALLDDSTRELQRINDSLEIDPQRLEWLNERNNTYNKLKLKYNAKSVQQLIDIQTDINQKITAYSSIDEEIKTLQQQAQHLAQILSKLGLDIEHQRRQASDLLSTAVLETLKAVGLSKTAFKIDINRLEYPNGILQIDGKNIQPVSSGINSLAIKVQTNEGLPFGNLSQVASGGEISRVMLAIKTALAEKIAISALVFDEIDTGVSGEVALKVGRVIEKLAENRQIITITHLPQIAAKGKDHYFIYKNTLNGRTVSAIRKLSTPERVIEIAKMLSGENPSATALRSAEELLNRK